MLVITRWYIKNEPPKMALMEISAGWSLPLSTDPASQARPHHPWPFLVTTAGRCIKALLAKQAKRLRFVCDLDHMGSINLKLWHDVWPFFKENMGASSMGWNCF